MEESKTKTVVAGRNPEGKPYFKKVKIDPKNPANVPTLEELPPIDPETGKPTGFQDDFLEREE